MSVKPESVDQFLETGCGRCKFGGTPDCKVHAWTNELRLLRAILKETDLSETIKWNTPCYTYADHNVVMISALKSGATLSFLRGSELKDPENVLTKPGEHSRYARYLKFTDVQTIQKMKSVILDYINDAIRVAESGVKAQASDDGSIEIPEELLRLFEQQPDFEQAFYALTPGRQRGYLLYFCSAKQSKTRTARIEKSIPAIVKGKGWNER